MTSALDILLCLLTFLSSLLCRIFHDNVLLRTSGRVSDDLGFALQDLAVLVCTSRINAVDPSLIKEDEEYDVISETSETVDCGGKRLKGCKAVDYGRRPTPWHVNDETGAVVHDRSKRLVDPNRGYVKAVSYLVQQQLLNHSHGFHPAKGSKMISVSGDAHNACLVAYGMWATDFSL